MSGGIYTINRVDTQDAYFDTMVGIFNIPPCGIVRINVERNPVYVERARGLQGQWDQEALIRPGVLSMVEYPPITAIRFRSATSGLPGLVSVEARI